MGSMMPRATSIGIFSADGLRIKATGAAPSSAKLILWCSASIPEVESAVQGAGMLLQMPLFHRAHGQRQNKDDLIGIRSGAARASAVYR